MAEMSRTPSAPACIVYTSGSTGGPKGVLLTHCLLLHRSDLQVLTAASFLTDPADGMRFFRTGDLGRWRKDGTLEHCGRKGRNIKLRGFSVEPFEVECELLRHPGISNAVVVSHQD